MFHASLNVIVFMDQKMPRGSDVSKLLGATFKALTQKGSGMQNLMQQLAKQLVVSMSCNRI